MGDGSAGKKVHRLAAEQELRLEIGKRVVIQLVEGTAEIFGHEIALNQPYEFLNVKLAVFTWVGCELLLEGSPDVEYIAEETPQWAVLNLHTSLEQMREAAVETGGFGPRVMVVGSSDSGKTSLCKTLCSYAFKRAHVPMFVDLDPADGFVTLPGSIAAMPVTKPIDPSMGHTLANPESVTTSGTAGSPTVHYFGYPKPTENPKFFKLLTTRLAQTIRQREQEEDIVRTSGYVIDTHGDIEGDVEGSGPETLVHAIKEFRVDIAVVLGHERLYFFLTRQLEGLPCTLIKFPKSGGVVARTPEFRQLLQNLKIKEYFYGTPGKLDLSPFSTTMKFGDLKVWRIGQGGTGALAPSSALPLGAERTVDETQLFPIHNADILLHSLLAVLDADDAPPEELALHETLGFVYLHEHREKEGQVMMLVATPGKFRYKHLLMGSYKWMEFS